ncbi:S8/S53 family peptidase [Caballeronia sp. ATUFL_F1_KS39]|uniref:S8/S53 family peptidase n=1 Tax=Caballeronia sp. ATUFL_F1_KS39 TaxID=2921766 RepID=UPI00202874CB|nr:S8/S53 family peptidase [Caballeronia sp. ATUFL_F1_KS39]
MRRRTLAIAACAIFAPMPAWPQISNADQDVIRRHELLIFVPQKDRSITRKPAGFDALSNLYIISVLSPGTDLDILSNGDTGKWHLATPKSVPLVETNPWDDAYFAARILRGAEVAPNSALTADNFYVEPNVESKTASEPAGAGPLEPPWPNGKHFAWHLDDEHTGLSSARKRAIRPGGCTPRITILDTGYDPRHESTPRGLERSLQRNYFDPRTRGSGNATDPGEPSGLLKNPTHGTGTLGILAGGKVEVTGNHDGFEGDLGGAPDARIVPVRISDSVIHFWTKEMAQGIDYAVDLPEAGSKQFCDVVSISMGGLPSRKWATAVNKAYEKGIVVVAAAGNNFNNLPTRFVVYPSRFARVVTVPGAMADYMPYVAPPKADKTMQGNYGPPSVMRKAVAAYTPNIPWARWGTTSTYDLDGAGTSAATPQVAAAFALWLQAHANQDHLALGPDRVDASMEAILRSADKTRADAKTTKLFFGRGLLRANDAMDTSPRPPFPKHEAAKVSFPFWRLLFGLDEPDAPLTSEDEMRELEALQISLQDPKLARYTGDGSDFEARGTPFDRDADFLNRLRNANISNELRRFLDSKASKSK